MNGFRTFKIDYWEFLRLLFVSGINKMGHQRQMLNEKEKLISKWQTQQSFFTFFFDFTTKNNKKNLHEFSSTTHGIWLKFKFTPEDIHVENWNFLFQKKTNINFHQIDSKFINTTTTTAKKMTVTIIMFPRILLLLSSFKDYQSDDEWSLILPYFFSHHHKTHLFNWWQGISFLLFEQTFIITLRKKNSWLILPFLHQINWKISIAIYRDSNPKRKNFFQLLTSQKRSILFIEDVNF